VPRHFQIRRIIVRISKYTGCCGIFHNAVDVSYTSQMPDPPPSKRRQRLTSSHSADGFPAAAESDEGPFRSELAPSVPYAELHCRTNYSFLEGASHADELAARAKELGLHSLAVTDRNSLAGVVRAHVAAKEAGLRLLIGAEIVPTDGPALVLLASDRAAYGRLSRLITVGRRRAPKGECRLTMSDVADHTDGLICCVPLSTETRLAIRTPLSAGSALYRRRPGSAEATRNLFRSLLRSCRTSQRSCRRTPSASMVAARCEMSHPDRCRK
jgi:hypothetical protein